MSGGNGDSEFEEFAAAGEVEVGESHIEVAQDGEKPKGEEKSKKEGAKRGPPKPAPAAAKPAKAADDGGEEEAEEKPKKAAKSAKAGEEDGGDEEEAEEKPKKGGEDDDEEEEEEEEKPKKAVRKPSERIQELTRRLRESERLRLAETGSLASRLEALEKGGLPKPQGAGKPGGEEVPAPDPSDTEKYPLGHLDDRYIEDKLEWLAEKKAADRADAALQRQQGIENNQAAERAQQALLEKVDDLAERGSDIEDFQEVVIDAGMRGDWALSQATFEAAHEVDNGAQILYELSQDKKEAKRVAGLSNFQQMKFVQDRDAEIGEKKKPRRIPKAGEPPLNQARGANSRTQINPATDNLDDFEKAWKQDEKKHG